MGKILEVVLRYDIVYMTFHCEDELVDPDADEALESGGPPKAELDTTDAASHSLPGPLLVDAAELDAVGRH